MHWYAIGQVSSVVTLLAFFVAAGVSLLRVGLKRRERLIKLAKPEDRSLLVEAVLDPLRVDTSRLSREGLDELALEKLRYRRDRFRWLVGSSVLVAILSGFVWAYAFSLEASSSEFYRVRLLVLDTDNRPLDRSELTSSVPGEKKRVEGGWEIEIPKGKRPSDDPVRFWLESTPDFLSGEIEVVLGDEKEFTLHVPLSREEVETKGRLLGRDEQPVSGTQVFVVGFPEEAVLTGDNGEFHLPSHAAFGQSIRLRVDQEGFQPFEQHHLAGHEATLMIEGLDP